MLPRFSSPDHIGIWLYIFQILLYLQWICYFCIKRNKEISEITFFQLKFINSFHKNSLSDFFICPNGASQWDHMRILRKPFYFGGNEIHLTFEKSILQPVLNIARIRGHYQIRDLWVHSIPIYFIDIKMSKWIV